MKILVYRRTHVGDPNADGEFGIYGCMGKVRNWKFEAVIGIGGRGQEATSENINCKITWIGISPYVTKTSESGDRILKFKSFILWDEKGDNLKDISPLLYDYMFVKNRIPRAAYKNFPPDIQKELVGLVQQFNFSQKVDKIQESKTIRTSQTRCRKNENNS